MPINRRLLRMSAYLTVTRDMTAMKSFQQRFNRRFRFGMMRHRWLIVLSGSLLLVALSSATLYFLSQPTTFVVAVGPPNSDDVKVVQFLGNQLARDNAPVRLNTVVAKNSSESAQLLDAGKADLAVVRHDLAIPRKGQAVLVLRKNYVALFAAGATSDEATPKLEKIEDIAGRRIGVVGRNQANIDLLKAILSQYEIPDDKISIVTIPTNDVTMAIRSHKPDVIMTVGPLNSKITTEAIVAMIGITPNRAAPIFLPIESSEAISEHFPSYKSDEIAKGAFGGAPPRPVEDIETISVSHLLMATKSASDGAIGDLARLLLAARQNLPHEIATIAKIEKPDTEQDAKIVVHPGAKAFFEDQQKTFFDRYGDMVFWSMMILPLIGSGLAGVASYVKAGTRTDHLRLLTRLLDVGRKARQVPDLDTLEQLQAEADELVIETVHRLEQGSLGDSSPLSFTLAIEQARHAIADRRAVLIAKSA